MARQTGAGAQAPAGFGAVVACGRFHGPRAALVGDAAHAVTSTLGQARKEGCCRVRVSRVMARAPRWSATPRTP